VHEGACHMGSSAAASNNPQLDGRVGKASEHRLGLKKRNTDCSRRSGFKKVSTSILLFHLYSLELRVSFPYYELFGGAASDSATVRIARSSSFAEQCGFQIVQV